MSTRPHVLVVHVASEHGLLLRLHQNLAEMVQLVLQIYVLHKGRVEAQAHEPDRHHRLPKMCFLGQKK